MKFANTIWLSVCLTLWQLNEKKTTLKCIQAKSGKFVILNSICKLSSVYIFLELKQ